MVQAVKVVGELQRAQEMAGPEAQLLSSPTLQNLRLECGLMASMRHPNVVQFLGVCACPPAIVTEYCGRGSLTSVLQEGLKSPQKAAQLTWQRRLRMAIDAAKGMLYLHKRGIVHRDLKSPNLLVDSSWVVKVADFNLSKVTEGAALNPSSTMGNVNPRWLVGYRSSSWETVCLPDTCRVGSDEWLSS
jgi:serine/threonine protein kinase